VCAKSQGKRKARLLDRRVIKEELKMYKVLVAVIGGLVTMMNDE